MTDNYFEARSVGAIARRLIASRVHFGLNQISFSKKAEIPDNTYNQYERGKSRPSLDYAFRLKDTYGLTLEWIYEGDPSNLNYNLAQAILRIHENLKSIPDPTRLKLEELEKLK